MRWIRKISMPHTFVVLGVIALICAVLTYVIPAGEYDREYDERTGRTLVVPGTYHIVEPSPIGLFEYFKSFQLGLIDAAPIVFFVFIVCGSVTAGLLKTGAIHALFAKAIEKLGGRIYLLIPLLMLFFGVLGTFVGIFEEMFPFAPVLVGLAIATGFDAIVGLSIVLTGVGFGFAAGVTNPFTVGIAQAISELPLFSGFGFRMIMFFVLFVIAVHHVWSYARKVKADPEKSLVKNISYEEFRLERELTEYKLTKRHVAVLVLFGLTIAWLIYTILVLGWYINEIAALFLIMGILMALAGGLGINGWANAFAEGCTSVAPGALVIGIARAIYVVMRDGHIIDTVIHGLYLPLANVPPIVAAPGMFIVNSIIELLIASGSGQAVVVMPITYPLVDLLGITRQVGVVAYQLADGFLNINNPTAGITLAYISAAKIPYGRWLRYSIPLVIKWSIAGIILIVVGVLIGLGPF